MSIRKEHIDKLYWISFTAVLVLLPWRILFSSYAMAIMVITGLISRSWNIKLQQIKQKPQVFIFPFLYLVYLVGLIYTPNLSQGIRQVDHKLVLFLVPLIAASSIPFTEQQRKSTLHFFVYSNILLTLACVVINLIWVSDGPHPQMNFDFHTLNRFQQLHGDASPFWMHFSYVAFSPFMPPTYLAMYLVLCILILAYYPATGKISYLQYAAIGWFIVVIILLSSRMGILLLLGVGMLNLLFMLRQQKFPIAKTVGAMAAVGVVCLLIWAFPVTHFRVIEEPFSTPLTIPKDYREWNSMNLRILEWQSGISGIKEHGVIGTGTGGTLDVLYANYHQLGDLKGTYNAHNQYIETYLEIGLTGFVAFLGCLIVPLYYAIKNKERLMLSIVLMVIVGCLTTSMFEKARGLVFYVTLVSMFMFTKNKHDEQIEGK